MDIALINQYKAVIAEWKGVEVDAVLDVRLNDEGHIIAKVDLGVGGIPKLDLTVDGLRDIMRKLQVAKMPVPELPKMVLVPDVFTIDEAARILSEAAANLLKPRELGEKAGSHVVMLPPGVSMAEAQAVMDATEEGLIDFNVAEGEPVEAPAKRAKAVKAK